VDGDAEIGDDVSHAAADVGVGAEVQRPAVGQPGGECFGDLQAAGAEPSPDRRGLLEERARIEHLEHFGVGVTDRLTAGVAEPGQDGRQLAAAGIVDSLQQPVVAGGR
jgi:hypothetical protein